MTEVVGVTGKRFDEISAAGWAMSHPTSKFSRPIVVIRRAPGRLLFDDGTIVKSEGALRAEREFER